MKYLFSIPVFVALGACGGGSGTTPSASSVVVDPDPAVVTDISNVDMTALKVGEGVEIASDEGVFAGVKGSTVTKMAKLDGQDVFLVNLVMDGGNATQTEIIASKDMNAYFTDLAEFTGRDAQEFSNIVPQDSIAGTSYVYGLNAITYDGTREDLFMYVNDNDGTTVLVSGYTSYRENDVETSRQYTAVNMETDFTAPSGAVELTGVGLLGKVGDTIADNDGVLVGGAATMSVDFDTLTGTIDVPSMTNRNETTGSMSSEFTVNATAGTFTGTTTANLDGEAGSGALIGAFNSDGSLAVGVSNLNDDDMIATFAVTQ